MCFRINLVPEIAQHTLPETNIAHENPIFPGKYHQNGGFFMAMLVSGRVVAETAQHIYSNILIYPLRYAFHHEKTRNG